MSVLAPSGRKSATVLLGQGVPAEDLERVSFVLRMTRDEIGSYLGLKLESISRLFSAFQKQALIEVQQREVSIVDIKGLERVLAPG